MLVLFAIYRCKSLQNQKCTPIQIISVNTFLSYFQNYYSVHNGKGYWHDNKEYYFRKNEFTMYSFTFICLLKDLFNSMFWIYKSTKNLSDITKNLKIGRRKNLLKILDFFLNTVHL